MRLHRLTFTAFGPFGATQEVDFDALSSAGLFLLHGPTGAGKTSVLDAVCYALYGAVPGARQSPGATLRSDHAPADLPTEVQLELTVGGRRLEVTRSPAQPRPKRRGDGFTQEKAQSRLRERGPEGGWKALSKSHQEIGEELVQLIGMSRDQFCQVVLLPQGDFARFLRADAEARGKLLGRLFDTRRFAAVEERLAELRRGAEARVKAGDEQILALAQRIAQAGGPAAAEAPQPTVRAGEPGLAEAVLEWAALARSAARERLGIAGAVVAAAEGRQLAAARALEAERERDRLQQRYAETRRRAQELEARRPEHDACQERLERARKADRVAPALELREEAERAYRAASDGLDRARALLPRDLSDAGADQLAELERRFQQELYALEAARAAEERSARIDEERDLLDREARADEELIRDADAWLADWDTTRTALKARIDAAQEAATRAEQLAGLLAPARRRLDAARRRDALATDVQQAERQLTAARERELDARASWLDLRERRLRGIAAELAAGLVAGAPCTVCGSAEHPAPASPGDGHVDRATEEQALAAQRSAEETRARTEQQLGLVRERYVAAETEALGDEPGPKAEAPTVAELRTLVDRLTDEHAEAHRLAAATNPAREALTAAEREHAGRLAQRQEAGERIAARTAAREALDADRARLAEQIAAARGESASVAAHAERLTRRVALLADAAEAVRAEQDAALRRKEADDRLSGAAFRAGFDTPQAAAATLLDAAAQRDLQHRIDAWQAEAAAVADRRAEQDAREAAELPPARPAEASSTHDTAEWLLREAASAHATARERCAELDRLSRRVVEEVRRLGPVREEYERVARLAGLTAGTSADNERKMRLESYVLAARLEQVAAAATARLQRMSAGRYTLVHSDARTGGRRAGLGLHVVDAWTGSERDTATLSGGETFFASLALALGLADVVTEEAGGVRLDTLFIDEGFGSLDDQTLDEVLDVLDSLRERDRSVGIVSHVADLRRRIPARLEVVKERHGSTVHHRL
ncbi:MULTISPECIES: AAA family ATPase [Streptomyces]|uniref:AAA family ATPase n=1 Tax=Streptomyces TaxID=1883 RepID=UPI001038D374|nr:MULTISPECIES: SMC family ATPase [Streptomyces]MBT3077699.1 SMC family ATPase [Streptomyces sp. COG21]MBT3084544.1 SMC family ATPase [Streptomyces sp. COG20]MBT3085450.1 SMC family ATPase [Streptomyces sp. CYG21]MBT3099044.1 SMC family ATPase [Streptomyces sp. CBG30]MBT3103508.1 SMC family ATPase [Streptomyces sp. COG19]